jgi:DNA-directed RNA polymerase specialized sigma subunit
LHNDLYEFNIEFHRLPELLGRIKVFRNGLLIRIGSDAYHVLEKRFEQIKLIEKESSKKALYLACTSTLPLIRAQRAPLPDLTSEQWELWEKHLPLVDRLPQRWVGKIPPQALDFDEFRSLAYDALLYTVRKFDPADAAAFNTLLTLNFDNRVKNELRRQRTHPMGLTDVPRMRFNERTEQYEVVDRRIDPDTGAIKDVVVGSFDSKDEAIRFINTFMPKSIPILAPKEYDDDMAFVDVISDLTHIEQEKKETFDDLIDQLKNILLPQDMKVLELMIKFVREGIIKGLSERIMKEMNWKSKASLQRVKDRIREALKQLQMTSPTW